jgi:uncharacterized protein with PhoU and TrkA domain
MRLPVTAEQQTVGHVETVRPGVSIILVQRDDVLLPRPASDVVLQEGDIVLAAGLDEAIDAFADS